MIKLTPAQIAEVKAKGFLHNRNTDKFSGRVVARGTVFTAKQLSTVAEIAEKFGEGKAICTTRLSLEITGIPYENIQPAMDFIAENGTDISFGGTRPAVRPVTACKGTTCIYGNYDTQELAAKIYDTYYIGWHDVTLPHKFKIAVGGCPNSCMKPSLNDLGIQGHKSPKYDRDKCKGCKVCQVEKNCPMNANKVVDGKLQIDEEICTSCGVCTGKCPFKAVAHESETKYKIFVGGTWGKRTRPANELSRYVTEEEVLPIIEKTMLWFKANAYKKERLGYCIDRLGIDGFEKDIFSDDILEIKADILNAPIKERTTAK